MRSDPEKIAVAGRRAAQLASSHGTQALRLTRDWATPLASPQGPGPRNAISDPTGTAATTLDPFRLKHATLERDFEAFYFAAVNLTASLLDAVSARRIENQRAGIGVCPCSRYCDGTPSNRLRNGICPACVQRELRAKAKEAK